MLWLSSSCVICRSVTSGLLDGTRIRPGMTNVSKDDRARGLGPKGFSLLCSDFGRNDSRLLEACIAMLIWMMHIGSWRQGVEAKHGVGFGKNVTNALTNCKQTYMCS